MKKILNKIKTLLINFIPNIIKTINVTIKTLTASKEVLVKLEKTLKLNKINKQVKKSIIKK